MNRISISNFLVAVALAAIFSMAAGASVVADSNDAAGDVSVKYVPIIVNGVTLTGPNNSAQRRDGRLFLPVTSVARSLGAAVNVSVASRKITVWRQNGVTAEFEAAQGRVSENGSLILVVASTSELIFNPNVDAMMVPAEIASSLFDISVRYDDAKNVVSITSGRIASDAAQNRTTRSSVELYRADYDYSLNRYAGALFQNLNLTASGRIADGRFIVSSNTETSSAKRILFRNTFFAFERPNGQRYLAGDFGTGASLAFMATNVRGASVSLPVRGVLVTAFGGKTYSGIVRPILDPLFETGPVVPVRNRFRYDTSLFGVYAATNQPAAGQQLGPLTLSAGAMRFSSPGRSGNFVTGGGSYAISRFRLQADTAVGQFSGIRQDGSRFNGTGAAVDLGGTFQASENLTFQARYAHIAENFLSPQTGLRDPVDVKAAGVTWSPVKWLSASLSANSVSQPGDRTQENKYVTAAFGITPRAGMPRLYVSHTQSTSSQVRSGAFTLVNASKDFSRFRLYLNASRIKTIGPATANAQIGTDISINDSNSIEFSQGFGSHNSLHGEFNWRTMGLFGHRLGFSAGVGYSHTAGGGLSTYERLSASVNLPRQTSLQINYYQTPSGPTLFVSLKGSLFKKRESQAFTDGPIHEINNYGKVSGRVYQDINLDGQYEPGIDRPQADVKVRIDGNRYVVSDENGLFRFDAVASGDHKVYLDLLSIRADLTLLGNSARDAVIGPGADSSFEFRLVRTGRVTGRVWFDANGNGKFDEDEKPLADIRIVTASGRDTLTDADGNFAITDLAPGEHIIFIDEKTLPEKTTVGTKPLAVQVFPGRETSDIELKAIPIPAEIKRFGSKP